MDAARKIAVTPTPYPDTRPQVHVKTTPLHDGIFDSYSDVFTDKWSLYPELDQPVNPGESRSAVHTDEKSGAYVTLTSGAKIPLHQRDLQESATHWADAPAGHDILNAQGNVVGHVDQTNLWLRDDPKLELHTNGDKHACQTIEPDGTTTFTEYTSNWEYFKLRPDGTASHSWGYGDEGDPVGASIDPSGCVAFYDKDVPVRVFNPVLPLKEYFPGA